MTAIGDLIDAFGLSPSSVLAVGDSMGGFGALLLGALLGAAHVVALNPQTVRPRLATPFDKRFLDDANDSPATDLDDLRPLWRAIAADGCP